MLPLVILSSRRALRPQVISSHRRHSEDPDEEDSLCLVFPSHEAPRVGPVVHATVHEVGQACQKEGGFRAAKTVGSVYVTFTKVQHGQTVGDRQVGPGFAADHACRHGPAMMARGVTDTYCRTTN